jgi:NitT/TauT family transport system ATP-binding protein
MTNTHLLQVHGLHFCYDTGAILKDLSFTLAPGEIASLIGLSGAGKSTLFKLLTGALQPAAGHIALSGQPLSWESQPVAYLMQEDLLLPWRSVLSNILLIGELGSTRYDRRHLVAKAHALLEEVGLSGKEQALPRELSGGQRQRVALVRALLLEKPLLLLDEPFSSLDMICREQLYLQLRKLQRRLGTTILMATHDFRDALCLSDRILLLDDGRISQEWIVEESMRQETSAVTTIQRHLRDALAKGGVGCAVG